MQLPESGALFCGKYQLLRVLGEGGFARVYHGRDTTIGRDIAVKILTPQNDGYPERVRKRFVREAQVIAELRGEYTITMFDFGTSPEGLLYMVFEFVPGMDVQTLLQRRQSLPPDVVEHVLRQMLQGLAEAHTIGVLHRDIKPANVIIFEHLGDPYRAKLIDFGIAKLFALESQVDLTKLTMDGTVVGTLRYLAPEQFYGDDLTPAADLYSCGLVALEMLLGTPAIAGKSRDEILRNQLSPDPIEFPDIPQAPHLTAALRAMTARNAEARPQSAGAALRILDGVSVSGSYSGSLSGASSGSFSGASSDSFSGSSSGSYSGSHSGAFSSASQSAPLSSVRPRGPRRGVLIAGLGLVAAVVVLVIGAMMLLDEDEPPAPPPRRSTAASALMRTAPATSDDAGHVVAAPTDAAAADAGGCAAPTTGLWSGEQFAGLVPRPYHVYVPERPAGERLPVVFVVHRLFGSGREFIGETHFSDVADEFGFIIISLGFTGDPDIDDMAKLYMDAYDEVGRRACVDTTRLFAVGHAGGGRHVRQLRCRLEFSAIAATSDGQHPDETNCEAPPVPFLLIWGRDDPHLPLDGSSSCMAKKYMTPEQVRDEWRRLNHCERTGSKKWPAASTGDCKLLNCEAPMVHCLVEGGFDWPNAPEPIEFPGCESPPMDFPVGRTIWKFFDEVGRQLGHE